MLLCDSFLQETVHEQLMRLQIQPTDACFTRLSDELCVCHRSRVSRHSTLADGEQPYPRERNTLYTLSLVGLSFPLSGVGKREDV